MRVLVLVTAALLSSSPARAEDPAALRRTCLEAHPEAQTLRREGRLAEARARLVVCADERCPLAIRKDCAVWLVEVDEALNAQQPVRTQAAPVVTQPAPPVTSNWRRPVAGGLAALGIAGVGGFTYLALDGRRREREAADGCAPFCNDAEVSAVRNRYRFADVALGAGLVCLVAATWLWFTQEPRR